MPHLSETLYQLTELIPVFVLPRSSSFTCMNPFKVTWLQWSQFQPLTPVLMLQVVQLLKAGKGKEVSYNALATHIIAEDGDNPEVGESREVFDLPVVKVKFFSVSHSEGTEEPKTLIGVSVFLQPSWVILSVRCGDLLPYPFSIRLRRRGATSGWQSWNENRLRWKNGGQICFSHVFPL